MQRRVFHFAWIGVVVLFIAWLLLLLFASGQVIAASLDGRDALVRAREAALELDFERASTELSQAGDRFGSAERGFVLLSSARVIPWVSDQVSAVETLIVSGTRIIDALQSIVDLGAELVRLAGFTTQELNDMSEGILPSATFDDLSSETKRAILERLAAAAPDLQFLSAQIAIARSDVEQIHASDLIGPLADILIPLDEKLAEAQEMIRTLSIAAELLPELAGLGEERTHLVLLLNNTELRPGGGFIGTFGILKMLNGDITVLETRDSYAIDGLAQTGGSYHQDPPPPLGRYNATSNWFFRDANWSPDFAVSAQEALRLYGLELASITPEVRAAAGVSSQTFDGVIGLTPNVIQALLGVTGPITIGSQTFSSDNVTDKIEYQVEVQYFGEGVPEHQRKEIIADLMNELKTRLFSLSLSDASRLISVFETLIQEKQLVFMSGNQDVEDTLTKVGWGGRVISPTGDIQFLVDANLASLKSDPKVSRAMQYEIFKNTSGQYVGRTSIRYTHTGSFDWKTTRYRTYTRLYVRDGSELVNVEGSMLNDKLNNPTGAEAPVDVANDLGLTSFGTFISIEPGESRLLTFEYLLAPEVVSQIQDGTYELTVLKQIGAQNNQLTLDLDFDKNVLSASVPEDSGEWGDDVYRLNTKVDQDLQIEIVL